MAFSSSLEDTKIAAFGAGIAIGGWFEYALLPRRYASAGIKRISTASPRGWRLRQRTVPWHASMHVLTMANPSPVPPCSRVPRWKTIGRYIYPSPI